MTEAGEKWARKVVEQHPIDVERVLRAFVDEVEKRAAALARANGHVTSNEIEAGAAFTALTRELLGGDRVHAK